MKNTRNSTTLDSVVYGIVMFIANAAGTVAIVFFLMLLNAVIGEEAANRHYVIFILLTALIAAAVVWLGSSFYFKYKIPDICKGETNPTILRSNFLFIVLPAEILRFILCCLPTMPGPTFGFRFCDGIFAIAPNFLYYMFYLQPNHRLPDIREFGYIFTDHIVFFVYYLVYFAINFCVLYLLFSRVWEKYDRERKSEVKIRMDPEQMK